MRNSMVSLNRFLLTLVAAFAVGSAAQAQVAAPIAPAQTTGAQVAPLQAPATPAAAPAAASDAGYIMGPDDVIEVDVLGQPEFKTRARVRADGTIALPFIGATQVRGETPISFATKVGATLRAGGYYANPIVNVEIASYASRYVVVLGEVGTPGLQPVDRAYRVSEIIARAGGMKPSSADHVIVRRENGEELKLPFQKLATGSDADDPVIGPGDKIFVPQVETFYIYGQVNAPGVYGIQEEMSLRKALARGGGLTQSGSDGRVKIFRDGKPLKAQLEMVIMPGDVIVVGERLF
jgi:polysaccharide export outer membrane protein